MHIGFIQICHNQKKGYKKLLMKAISYYPRLHYTRIKEALCISVLWIRKLMYGVTIVPYI